MWNRYGVNVKLNSPKNMKLNALLKGKNGTLKTFGPIDESKTRPSKETPVIAGNIQDHEDEDSWIDLPETLAELRMSEKTTGIWENEGLPINGRQSFGGTEVEAILFISA